MIPYRFGFWRTELGLMTTELAVAYLWFHGVDPDYAKRALKRIREFPEVTATRISRLRGAKRRVYVIANETGLAGRVSRAQARTIFSEKQIREAPLIDPSELHD